MRTNLDLSSACARATGVAAAIALALAWSAGPVQAGPALDACAAAAASPYEAGYEEIGRHGAQVDSSAIGLCEAAVEAEPDSLQAKAWLGRAHYYVGDANEAAALLKQASEGGIAIAQSLYGEMLLGRSVVPEDAAAAEALLKPLAESGFAQGQFDYARMFDWGVGHDVDFVEAAKWYQLAADQDHPRALYSLGNMYEVGDGVTQDYSEALRLYARAAALQEPWGERALGMFYERGLGVAVQDYVAALAHYERSAALGNIDAWVMRHCSIRTARASLRTGRRPTSTTANRLTPVRGSAPSTSVCPMSRGSAWRPTSPRRRAGTRSPSIAVSA